MIRKLIVGSSKIFFTFFIITIVGFMVICLSIFLCTDYLNTVGFDNFVENISNLISNILLLF